MEPVAINSHGGFCEGGQAQAASTVRPVPTHHNVQHSLLLRSVMARISAACHEVIFFAIARKITSCTFIARSTAALGYVLTLHCMKTTLPPEKRTFHFANTTGHIMC